MKQLSMALTSLSLCALLFCAILLLLPAQSASLASSSTQAEKESVLFSYAAEQLDTITFTHPNQSFTLVNLGTHFALENFPSIPLETNQIQSLLSLLEHFPGGEPTSFSLDAPCRIEITPVNEASQVILVQQKGDLCLISHGSACYQLPLDQTKPLFWSVEDYVDTTIASISPKNRTGFLWISGELHPEPLQISFCMEENTLQANMISPSTEKIQSEKMEPILNSLFCLIAEKTTVLFPSDMQIQSAGLFDPFCTVQLDFGEDSFTLSCSKAEKDGSIFLMKDELPVIYQIDLASAPWYSACLESLTSVSLFLPQYEDTTCLIVSTPENQYRFTKWDGQVLCGNKKVDENEFFQLFQLLSTLTPTEAALFPSENRNPILSLSFSYTNPAKNKDTIQFFPYDKNRVYLSMNGETKFLTAYSYVESIVNQCDELLKPS